MEPGDLTDIEQIRLVVSPASRSVEIHARSHNTHTGPQVYEGAVCTTQAAHSGVRYEPLMTLHEDAAWDMFKEMCRAYAGDYSVLEFNEITKTMEVKSPGAGGGRFIPAGERTPLEAQLLEKVDLLERLVAAKDENLADIRSQLSYTYTEQRDPNVPLTIPQLNEGY